MIAVDAAVIEFVRLLDVAIAIAEKMKACTTDALIVESADTTVKNLRGFRDMAISGGLPRPSKGEVPQGTGLGLTRGVGEWTEDDELLDAVYEAENYYKNLM
ncbi:UNVERIFIED_ORG: hypothetical protein J2Y76_001319 [Pseudomonas reinekei]|uniref:hypothetical protein n=1 Tax=Pseudomonas laurylsulfatiphila TaxID=2011015 RepID=UPI003D2066BC|nr:hypothetical protein [Pseudomonas reinekei]